MIIDLEFIVNGKTYTGEAKAAYGRRNLLWYEIELYSGDRFTIEKDGDIWKSDFKEIPHTLITAAGNAIDFAINKKAQID